ncbi:hypothetical protein GGX14DRAFT_406286 [Mycena pura]|uniref:Uncharacterized protein n=1 Tax=Mycena pura TaxID=153505 RepID=A0AAD6UTI7_9AGAR|nr:hypothetical protein GGX14DRAFT_406286 [Mycena pura]
MSFVPRCPPARSPPPAYEMPPTYGDPESGAPATQQSSSSPPRLCPVSVSPTLSELELRVLTTKIRGWVAVCVTLCPLRVGTTGPDPKSGNVWPSIKSWCNVYKTVLLTPVTWSDHPRISRVPELALALPSQLESEQKNHAVSRFSETAVNIVFRCFLVFAGASHGCANQFLKWTSPFGSDNRQSLEVFAILLSLLSTSVHRGSAHPRTFNRRKPSMQG